jgi:hypothetical protein
VTGSDLDALLNQRGWSPAQVTALIERCRGAEAQLERISAIEARRDAYGREHCVRYPRGGGVEVEYELGSGRGDDYHAALEAALNDAGAP